MASKRMHKFSTIVHPVDKVLVLLKEEAKLFRGAEAEAESLKPELQILRATLEDVYEPRSAMQIARMKELTELRKRVKFVLQTYRQNLSEPPRPKRAVINFFYSPANEPAKNIKKRAALEKIEDILSDFSMLVSYSKGSGSTSVGLLEYVPRFFEEEELVGIKTQKEELLRVLVGTEPSKRSVILLAGVSGVGKTTLASVVYQSKEVQQHFDCRAWIDVSQSYDFGNLVSRLTKMLCPDKDFHEGDIDTKPEPISHLYQYLPTKRCVIVFDGVWQSDFFQFVNEILPDNNKGSRIIITTRNKAIAASCDIAWTLQPLSEKMALRLFTKSALETTDEGNFWPELYELSLETLRRCHGLPLLIWAMGDILRSGRHVRTMAEVISESKTLLNELQDEIGENPSHIEEVSRIFYHNYDKLPSRSRLCLMYFGIFPKHYLIPDGKLVKLWIAEGFVKEEMGKTLEQVAETYLNDLIDRNLVQVSHINYDGTERLCRVHGFMHCIISERARSYKICQILKETTSRSFINEEVCRLSIHGNGRNTLEITTKCRLIRSVFIFGVNEIVMTKSFVVNLFEKLKLLELLDFENTLLDDLPNEVGNLSLLKYLSLRNTKVKKLPKSVGLLLNLETLDVRNTLIHELPIHLQKLRKLRHLMASAYNNKGSSDSVHGVQIKEGIGCLENLQTLMTVEADRYALAVIEEFEKLRQLRCLSISNLTADIVGTLCSIIEKLNLLESLSLYLCSDRETFDLESISSPPPLIRRLILKGRLEKLPDWILGLQNLSVLGLSFSRLAVDPLSALQCLPNLKFLWLHRAYDGEQLHFEGVSFQKLKQLVLTELNYLRMLKIERGALPLLEELRLGPCQNEFSFDVQNLKNLQRLECYDMSDEFVLRLQPEGGSDYWKVKHVPSVVFRYQIHGSRYVSYKLGEPALLDRLKRLERRTSNVEFYSRQLSFFYNDDEVARTSNAEWSDQYSDFTDDIEY